MCNTNLPKKTQKSFFVFPRLYVQAGGTQMSTELVVARGQQTVPLLLSTVQLAERMLLYNVVLAAWILLPERCLLEKSIQACRGRLSLSRAANRTQA
jgi:hypothetical protein